MSSLSTSMYLIKHNFISIWSQLSTVSIAITQVHAATGRLPHTVGRRGTRVAIGRHDVQRHRLDGGVECRAAASNREGAPTSSLGDLRSVRSSRSRASWRWLHATCGFGSPSGIGWVLRRPAAIWDAYGSDGGSSVVRCGARAPRSRRTVVVTSRRGRYGRT